MTISVDLIKELREKTGAGVMEAKKALEEASIENKAKMSKDELMKRAEAIVAKKGVARAESKADRDTSQGVVYAYIHHDQMKGAMVKLVCETDFVARTDEFRNLAKELAMQVVSMEPKSVAVLLKQAYVRDPGITVGEFIKKTAGMLGENIKLEDFTRLEV